MMGICKLDKTNTTLMNHLNITVLKKKPQTLALKPPHVSSELTKLGGKK